MNEKWLKIYKKYRERKYNRDLDKLQASFAERGLAQSGISNREERWLQEDYEDEVAMEQERIGVQTEISKERKTAIWANRILAFVAILSFLATVFFSYKTLELNYIPSIDVQYSSLSEDIQVYNRGKTNLYIWGSVFNGKKQDYDSIGRLISPEGLPYHFPGKDLNKILAELLDGKENVYVPFDLLFKDNRGTKYISKHYFFVFKKGEQIGIDVQTTAVERWFW